MPVLEGQPPVVRGLQMVHQPVARSLDRVHPRRRRQIEVQQPRHRRPPLTRRLFVAFRAGAGVEADQVVEAVAAGGGGFQEGGVDQGFQEVFRVLRRQVQDRGRGRQGRLDPADRLVVVRGGDEPRLER